MWQEQLISIVEGNSLDPNHIADLLVTYEAETGDTSLRGCGEVLMFMGALRPWTRFKFPSGPWSRSVARSRSASWSGSGPRSASWSGSGPRFRSMSRSWSRFWSRSKFR